MTIEKSHQLARTWIEAARTKDVSALLSLMSQDIVLCPPFQDEVVEGRQKVLETFAAFSSVTENFDYGRIWPVQNSVVLEFSAHVNGQDLHALELLSLNKMGEIERFEVFARPVVAVTALGTAVKGYCG